MLLGAIDPYFDVSDDDDDDDDDEEENDHDDEEKPRNHSKGKGPTNGTYRQ